MDPVGPWSAYASYNRLAGVQAGATGGDFHHHLTSGSSGLAGHSPAGGVPSTTSQLLLQAAHTTASLAGQLGTSTASPFNPGGFLSPAPVAYDTVFSPLFHHTNPKPAHYSPTINAQHRQVLAQAQAQAAAAASKQAAAVDSELTTLRENYSSHHQTLAGAQGATFFDQSSAPAGASGLAWQGNNQLPSPFGILPHESVVPSSPSPATSKSSSAVYENFNAHFAAAQSLNNHLNSQLSASGANKSARSSSPQSTPPVKPQVSQASAASGAFFQAPTSFATSDNVSTYSSTIAKGGQLPSQQDYASAGKQRANSAASTPAPSQQHGALSANAAQEVTPKAPEKKVSVPVTGPGSGFMASYLKFLQGERDTSPPPTSRGGRKATWSRNNTTNNSTKAFSAQNDQNKTVEVQNTQAVQNANGAMPPVGAMSSPAMSVPGSLNTSVTMSTPGALTAPGALAAAGIINVSGVMGSIGSVISPSQAAGKSTEPAEDSRYFSHNKDKKRKFDGTDEAYESVDDEARRMNKPVLNVPSTPLNEKGKKGRGAMNKPPAASAPPQPAVPKKARAPQPPPAPLVQPQPQQQYYYQQPEEVAAHGAGIDYTDYSEEENQAAKKMQQRNIQQPTVLQSANSRPGEDVPYQIGEFIAIKSELNEAWPTIWRVDGKTLLQRFDPFDQNGKVMYRNISMYSAWNPENKKSYVQVPVRVRVQSQMETIVELIRNDLPGDDSEFIEKRVQETLVYQDNFEVYIQTLISHALDPNFLTEIFQEQDEYFLSNVKTVDEVTEERRRRVLGAGVAWPRAIEAALATWPCISVATDAPTGGVCRVCARPAVIRASLYGQPYNPATLDARSPDPRVPYEKDFLACRACCIRAQMYIRVAHQKYLMFMECSKRVTDKRIAAPHKDTTVVLNELLADEAWLSQLFRDIRQTWSEAELMERKSRQDMPPRQMI